MRRPLAGEAAGIDTELEVLVEEAADTGSAELVEEAGPARICHRSGRNHQAIDRKTCRAS